MTNPPPQRSDGGSGAVLLGFIFGLAGGTWVNGLRWRGWEELNAWLFWHLPSVARHSLPSHWTLPLLCGLLGAFLVLLIAGQGVSPLERQERRLNARIKKQERRARGYRRFVVRK